MKSQAHRALLVPLLLALWPLWLPAAENSEVGKVKSAVESRYNRVRTLEADFVQRYTLGAQTLVESGQVAFEKPGKMRWEYDNPPGKLFLADGDYAYLYLPSEQLVRRQPLKEAGQWQAAFALLLGRVDLDRFLRDIVASRVYRPDSPTRWQLRGSAKSDKQPFYEVWMDINDRYQLQRIEIRQRDGSLMEFHFRNWTENPALAPGLFTLQVPPGTSWVQVD